jgi:3-dehydrosphinganine reductase
VVALDDAQAEALRQEALPRLVVAPADVTDPDQVTAALEAGREAHGPIRSLITCAGIVRPAYFHDLSDAELRRHMEINYFGTLHAVRHALPDLMARRGATVTCISSAAGLLGVFGYSAYCASKFAVRGLCEVLRQEYKPYGITVTAVYPPDVDTPMLAGEQQLKPPELLALSGGKKPLTAEEVALAMLRGTEAGRFRVVPGARTKALAFAAGALPGIVFRLMDARIAAARRTAVRLSPARPPAG